MERSHDHEVVWAGIGARPYEFLDDPRFYPVFMKNSQTNFTFQETQTAYLHCSIHQLEDKVTFVYAMRTSGQGHVAMTTLCYAMYFLSPIAEKSYNNVINELQLCNKEAAEASMQSAALEEVTLTYSSDLIISGDGKWKTMAILLVLMCELSKGT
ncbi:hypothetical protein TNCT_535721 [Trichonephila clavata]|uniref:Uncharacterized protein n=1 Tax=Trichonephila clavata TaxID=2740835 RepID=A0A8X6FEY5_TRICU|nr:hypothetical protein TNCT_535721 [Trichonephila clavata]